MGFAVIFFGFAAVFTWGGETFRTAEFPGSIIVALVFYQAAVAELFTGALYLSASWLQFNPGHLFKTPLGPTRMLPRLFAWPFLLFEWRGYAGSRRQTREPKFEEVRQGLFIGSRITAKDLPEL